VKGVIMNKKRKVKKKRVPPYSGLSLNKIDNIIFNEILPKILTGKIPGNDNIDPRNNYDELYQYLALDYLEKKVNGKWENKGIGYIKNALNNKLNDYYDKNIFIDPKYYDNDHSQLLAGEVLEDDKKQFVKEPNMTTSDSSIFNSSTKAELSEQEKIEINLFLPNAQVPFSKKRKQDHFELIPTKEGIRYLHTIEDKIKPYIPNSYKNKIYISGTIPDNPIAKNIFNKHLTRLDQKGIIKFKKKQEKYLANVKKLYFDFLDRFSKYSHTDWNRRFQFTYKDNMTQFCKMYKYNGWNTLNRYSKEYRKETGIQAEYYFYNQIKIVINKINEKAKKSFYKYGDLTIDEYCTQTNICNYLGLKQNHPRVMLFLEDLVYAQQINFDENTHTYRVLK